MIRRDRRDLVMSRARSRRRHAHARKRSLRTHSARIFRAAPSSLQLLTASVLVLVVWLAANSLYQVVRKPSELLFPWSDAYYKTPEQTWSAYGALFERHSTDLIDAPLLAALAQAEGAGNPIVRTYWRFKPSRQPFEIFRPASSAVGMFQITDGTFAEARRYCIHDHALAEDGPWYAMRSCWFNSLYTRLVPSHAIELTAAHLHLHTARIIRQAQLEAIDVRRRRELAAVIHLCGPAAARRFVLRGLQGDGERCGSHEIGSYVSKVTSLEKRFEQLAAGG
jgi:hypothetical protein